jgi:hypothetical protein
MPADFLSAIVTGSCTVAGAIAGATIPRFFEPSRFQPVPADRVRAVCGQWNGEMKQRFCGNEDEVKWKFSLFFESVGRRGKLRGTIIIPEADNKSIHLELNGGFINPSYIKFDYSDRERGNIRYGLFLCKVMAIPRTLEGEFLGYSAIREMITFGYGTAQKT